MSNSSSHQISVGRKLWTLMKVQMLTSFRINQLVHEKDKKKHGRSIIYLIAMLLLFIMLVAYSYLIGAGLGFIGMVETVPVMAFTISSVISLFFTMLKSLATLFGFKDYDMLMCLPVSSKTVITSKFMYMYVTNEVMAIGIMAAMGIAYGMWAPMGIIQVIIWILGTITAPLIPMTIATMLGGIIAAITSRVKHKNLISVVLSFACIYGVMMFNIKLNSSDESDAQFYANIKDLGSMLTNKMLKLYPLTALFQNGIRKQSLLPVLLLIAVSVVWYLIFVNLTAIGFTKINTKLKAHQTKSSYSMQTLKTSSPVMALVKKELARFLSSPGYIVNCMVGALMALLFSAFCVIKGPESVIQTFAGENFGSISQSVLCALPFFLSAFLGMSCTSSVSLSLEGKSLWILKSMPLEPRTILQTKIMFDLALKLPITLISEILLLIAFRPTSFFVTIWFILTPVVCTLFSTMWGAFLNVKLPNYEWENEMAVIKQGASSTLSVFGGLLFFGIAGVGVIFIGIVGFGSVAAAALTLITSVVTFILYRCVMKVKQL